MHVTAEVRGATEWKTISVVEALRTVRLNPLLLIRCAECYGRVLAQRGGLCGPRFIHVKQHGGCSRASGFDGTPRMHPDALE